MSFHVPTKDKRKENHSNQHLTEFYLQCMNSTLTFQHGSFSRAGVGVFMFSELFLDAQPITLLNFGDCQDTLDNNNNITKVILKLRRRGCVVMSRNISFDRDSVPHCAASKIMSKLRSKIKTCTNFNPNTILNGEKRQQTHTEF